MSVREDIEQLLHQEISSRGGFMGAYLDERTVESLEGKLAEHGIEMDIFYLMAVDTDGHPVLMVPIERAKATSFKTVPEAFAEAFAEARRDTGQCAEVEEAELIAISRFKQQSAKRHVAQTAFKIPVGMPCIPTGHHIKSIKKKKKK